MRAAWIVLVGILATSVASASHGSFDAREIDVVGQARVEGAPDAAFVRGDIAPFAWTLSAGTAVVERHFSTSSNLRHPINDDADLYGENTPWDIETTTLTQVNAVTRATDANGATLLLGPLAEAVVATGTSARATTTSDPTFSDGEAPTFETEEGTSDAFVETIDGDYVEVVLVGAAAEVRGDFALLVTGVRYDIDSSQGRSEERTGHFTTKDDGVTRERRVEHHRLVVTDGLLTLTTTDAVRLVTQDARLHAASGFVAHEARGALVLADDDVVADSGAARYARAATLSLRPDEGRIDVAAAGPSLATASIVVPGRTLGWGLIPAAVAVGVALYLALRRRRQDPIQAALLSMDEGAWLDAVRHLDTALAASPSDADLLLDRAICLERAGRLADASRAFERTLRTTPDRAEAHLYYARTLLRLRNEDVAAVHIDRALSLDPRLAEMATRDAVLSRYV